MSAVKFYAPESEVMLGHKFALMAAIAALLAAIMLGLPSDDDSGAASVPTGIWTN